MSPTQPAEPPAHVPPPEGHRPPRRRWLHWMIGAGMLGAVILVTSHASEQAKLLEVVRRLSPGWLLVALLLQVGTYLAQGGVWRSVLLRAGERTGWTTVVRLSLAKLFLDETLPTGGVSGTLLFVQGLRQRGRRRPAVMTAVIVNTVSYWASFILLLLAAVSVARLRGPTLWAVLGGVAAMAALGTTMIVLLLGLARGREVLLARVLCRIRPVRGLVDALSLADRQLASDKRLLVVTTLQQASIHLLDALTLWVLLLGLGFHASLAGVFASFMISMVVRTMSSMIPAGLGTFEAASVGMLSLMGISAEGALAGTLLFRGVSLWLPLVPGLLLCRPELRRSAVAPVLSAPRPPAAATRPPRPARARPTRPQLEIHT